MVFGQSQIIRRRWHPVWRSFGKQTLVYAQELIGQCAAEPQSGREAVSEGQWQVIASEADCETPAPKAARLDMHSICTVHCCCCVLSALSPQWPHLLRHLLVLLDLQIVELLELSGHLLKCTCDMLTAVRESKCCISRKETACHWVRGANSYLQCSRLCCSLCSAETINTSCCSLVELSLQMEMNRSPLASRPESLISSHEMQPAHDHHAG